MSLTAVDLKMQNCVRL